MGNTPWLILVKHRFGQHASMVQKAGFVSYDVVMLQVLSDEKAKA